MVDVECDDFFKLCTSSVNRVHAYTSHINLAVPTPLKDISLQAV